MSGDGLMAELLRREGRLPRFLAVKPIFDSGLC